MFKRFFGFYNKKIILTILMVVPIVLVYAWVKKDEILMLSSGGIFLFIFLGLFTVENMWRNIKYIKTGKIEDMDDGYISNDLTLKLLKAARSKKDIPLFIPNRLTGEYFYYDDDFKRSE